MFNFSDTWQLVINTGTTIVTFLMVFLIQNTQNRDTVALHAKVDELIIKLDGADNALVIAEDMSDEELEDLMKKEKELAARLPSSNGVGQSRARATRAAHDAEHELERRRVARQPPSQTHGRQETGHAS
jgi:low affinity Fe/Cu permease